MNYLQEARRIEAIIEADDRQSNRLRIVFLSLGLLVCLATAAASLHYVLPRLAQPPRQWRLDLLAPGCRITTPQGQTISSRAHNCAAVGSRSSKGTCWTNAWLHNDALLFTPHTASPGRYVPTTSHRAHHRLATI